MDDEKVYIVLSDDQTDKDGKPVMYCFEESCLDSVRTEGTMPESSIFVNVDTIEPVTSWDDIDKTIKLNGTTIKCGEDKLYKNCKSMAEWDAWEVGKSDAAEDATYYAPGETAYVEGLIMCVGVFAVDPRNGIVALHYVTGESGTRAEQQDAKLDRLIELTQKHDFHNYELFVAKNAKYVLSSSDEQKREQDIRRIIQKVGPNLHTTCITASSIDASDGSKHYHLAPFPEDMHRRLAPFPEEKTTEEEDRRAKRW